MQVECTCWNLCEAKLWRCLFDAIQKLVWFDAFYVGIIMGNAHSGGLSKNGHISSATYGVAKSKNLLNTIHHSINRLVFFRDACGLTLYVEALSRKLLFGKGE